jgi:2-dehydrotetronate isomerase
MPQFAANLSFLYLELPFLDRFEAAARDGFKAVEYMFPYAFDVHEISARLRANGLQQALFSLPAGGTDAASSETAWAAGVRGLACLPGRGAELLAGAQLALRYAQVLECPRVHMMAGLLPDGSTRADLLTTYTDHARAVGKLAAQQGVDVLIEPINNRDMPGFFLNRQDHAHELIAAIDLPNVKVQMDLYHCQVVEGDVATKIRQYLPTGKVGHFQIAGVPERHEPNVGEMNYPYLFDLIDSLGYTGWIGCEYKPARGAVPGGSSAGLGWLVPYLEKN